MTGAVVSETVATVSLSGVRMNHAPAALASVAGAAGVWFIRTALSAARTLACSGQLVSTFEDSQDDLEAGTSTCFQS